MLGHGFSRINLSRFCFSLLLDLSVKIRENPWPIFLSFDTSPEPERPIPRTRRRIDNFYWILLPEVRRLDLLNKATVKFLLLPGGLLLAAVALLQTGLLTLTVPGLMFVFYGAVTAGLLLAWRFHSSRVFFALLLLLLAQEATAVFSAGRLPLTGSGHTALEAVALLVPLNFVLLSLLRERGFAFPNTGPLFLLLFVQSTAVFAICRALPTAAAPPTHGAHHAAALASSLPLPGYLLWVFVAAGVTLLVRFLLLRKPVESALLWSLFAFFLAVYSGGQGRIALAYSATAALILAVSIIETSYLLAYHDELTTLPSRRALNDALLSLEAPYSIAMVDIDHFKQFNDQHGHDTGDQVLRLVAAKLARVTGGGNAYRCGGEEFTILFAGKTTDEVVEPLEQLRRAIEAARFRPRGIDRRQTPRGPDRRTVRQRGRARVGHAVRRLAKVEGPGALSVTVSIGVAASTQEKADPNRIMDAADKALYRAKGNGRNRVETASAPRRRARVKTAGIA
jgi:GGDEF domain-containing protein